MVTDNVRVRDKYRLVKRIGIFLAVIIVIGLVLGAMFMFGFFSGEKTEVILENPLKDIVLKHTDEAGIVDEQAVVEEGVLEFNEDYINYILVALGVGHLHKSPLFENPLIEFVLGDEVWNSEIIKGMPDSRQGEIDNEDLRISISKQEAVKALLSPDIEQFMRDSVAGGRTGIEMIAGKTELFSKGYLEMYGGLTGEEV